MTCAGENLKVEDLVHRNFGQDDKGSLTACYVGTPDRRSTPTKLDSEGSESAEEPLEGEQDDGVKSSSHSPISATPTNLTLQRLPLLPLLFIHYLSSYTLASYLEDDTPQASSPPSPRPSYPRPRHCCGIPASSTRRGCFRGVHLSRRRRRRS